MAYRIEVDSDVCFSSGMCVADAPETFRFNDEDIAEVIPGAPRLSDDAQLRLARGCPSSALQVFDGDQPISIF